MATSHHLAEFLELIKPALKDLRWDITSKPRELCWERCSNCYIYLERDLEVTPPQGRGVSSQTTCLGNLSGSTGWERVNGQLFLGSNTADFKG